MSLRALRSPVPPKMTMALGSGTRARRSPARRGFTAVAVAVPLLLLDRVAAELVPESGRDLHREGVVLPRGEAREERVGEDGRGNVVRDGLEDGPAALAGIGDVALDPLEVAALLLERPLGELEEPRPHDAPVVPHSPHLPDLP